MSGNDERVDLLDTMLTDAVRAGVIHLSSEDQSLTGRTLCVGGRDLTHFGSCSYLGLEMDPRLRDGAIDATRRYGTQFSSSRTYVSAPLYPALEETLGRILGGHVLVTPSTTLGHLATLPSLVGSRDAAVLDHQVHQSVHLACQHVRAHGSHVELFRHDQLDRLDERIHELAREHEQVWYLADGVYSMFGDLAPMPFLIGLLDRHPSLRLYIDDAHGMSWAGPLGCGTALSQVALHPRMIVATSLNKSFAAAGGAIVFPERESLRRVRTVGGPMIFSGPIQPPMLGAALASATIHASGEVETLQAELHERIEHCTRLLVERNLPLVSTDATPVRFIATGFPRIARRVGQLLLEDGFFANVSHFPAVPMKQAGIRMTLTRHHRPEDIEAMVESIDRSFATAFAEAGEDPAQVWQTFGLSTGQARTRRCARQRDDFVLEQHASIAAIDPAEWNACLGGRGAFDWQALRFLEEAFHSADKPEDEWTFRYFLVRDSDGRIVLATFFSAALWKADMLSSEDVSREVELRRAADPYALTSRVFAMGSLLTDGNHLYIDDVHLPTGSPRFEKALSILLTRVREVAGELGCETIALRDLPASNLVLEDFLRGHGFACSKGPHRFTAAVYGSEEELLGSMRGRPRRFQRREVEPWNDTYSREILGADASPGDLAALNRLYQNVRERSFEINTFALPDDLLVRMIGAPGWEVAVLRRRDEQGQPEGEPVAMWAGFAARGLYCPMVVGLDYAHVRSAGLYRQTLRHAFARARELGASHIALGMGAGLEKRRFGATPEPCNVYIQADDHYALDVVQQIADGLAA